MKLCAYINLHVVMFYMNSILFLDMKTLFCPETINWSTKPNTSEAKLYFLNKAETKVKT